MLIGSGGFGKVYRYGKEFAIKEEYKVWLSYAFTIHRICLCNFNFYVQKPLIMVNPEMFDKIIQLENENVMPVLEYLVGMYVYRCLAEIAVTLLSI